VIVCTKPSIFCTRSALAHPRPLQQYLPAPSTSYDRGFTSGFTALASPASMQGLGKRPAPGLSFLKVKKKAKAQEIVKDIFYSTVDESGKIEDVFPICLNLTNLAEAFGSLSTHVICSAVEQELRQQGEVVRMTILDVKGKPIMDSTQTKSKFFFSHYSNNINLYVSKWWSLILYSNHLHPFRFFKA